MKFNELKFTSHPSGIPGTQATVFFPNGYGASVITGKSFYTSPATPYELAVLRGDRDKFDIAYDTHITNDVLGYLTESDVEVVLNQIEALEQEK